MDGEDRQKAVEHLEEMLKNDPTNAQAHYLLGWLAQEQQDVKTAEDHYRRSVLLAPDYEPAYYGLATTQMAQEKVEDALVTLGEARRRFQKRFQMERLEAMCHMQKEDFAKALRHFTEAEIVARAMEPELLDGFFYFQYGAAYERNGDYLSAERHLKKSLELMPDFPEAQNYLGYMWADIGINLQESLELIQAALVAEPDNAAYLDSLAWVLFKLDRPGEALEQMRKAIELIEEPDATLYDHLGDIYEALHMPAQAIKAWQKSVEILPDETVQEKLDRARGEDSPLEAETDE
jgi:tetratricopeptide (TPR) repeat protein